MKIISIMTGILFFHMSAILAMQNLDTTYVPPVYITGIANSTNYSIELKVGDHIKTIDPKSTEHTNIPVPLVSYHRPGKYTAIIVLEKKQKPALDLSLQFIRYLHDINTEPPYNQAYYAAQVGIPSEKIIPGKPQAKTTHIKMPAYPNTEDSYNLELYIKGEDLQGSRVDIIQKVSAKK